MTHAYGPSALQARCGAPNVYCSVYAREVTCACDRPCQNCGHTCGSHGQEPTGCFAGGCDCEAWAEMPL